MGTLEFLIAFVACMFSIGLPIFAAIGLWVLYQRQQATTPCVRCGAAMRPRDKFCANCGEPRAGRTMSEVE